MIHDAERLINENGAGVAGLVRAIYSTLVDEGGCSPYVKTIYVGFEIDGEMVAALYPHADSVEIALALAEDHPSPVLQDATHLTWRSLPVLAEVRLPTELDTLQPLLQEAVGRVRNSAHGVDRPPEYFMGRRRRIADPRLVRGVGPANDEEKDDAT